MQATCFICKSIDILKDGRATIREMELRQLRANLSKSTYTVGILVTVGEGKTTKHTFRTCIKNEGTGFAIWNNGPNWMEFNVEQQYLIVQPLNAKLEPGRYILEALFDGAAEELASIRFEVVS